MAAAAALPSASDDRQRGWSGALFAAKSRPFDRRSTDIFRSEARAEDLQKSDERRARPPTAVLHAEGRFVARSPSGEFRSSSGVFACLTVRHGSGGQPSNGRQDKRRRGAARSVYRFSRAYVAISRGARVARSLRNLRTHWLCWSFRDVSARAHDAGRSFPRPSRPRPLQARKSGGATDLQAVMARTQTDFRHADDTNFDFTGGGPTTRFTPLPLRRQRIGPSSARLVELTLCSAATTVRQPIHHASASDARAEDLQRSGARNAHPWPATLQADGLFVAGSPERQFRGMADVFVGLTVRRPIDQRTAR